MSLNPIVSPAVDLRPLSAGQLFDRAIRLYRNNFLTFVGIIALSRIPIAIASILLVLLAPAPELADFSGTTPTENFFLSFMQAQQAAGTSSSIFGTYVIAFFAWGLSLVGAAALTRAAVDAYFGNPAGILESYRRLDRRWWSLLGAVFLAGIVGALLGIWTMIPLVGWFTGPGLIMFYSFVVQPFIIPVIVIEEKNASQGLPRALSLAQKRFWWFLGFMILLAIFAFIVVIGPAMLFGGVITALLGNGLNPTIYTVLSQALDLFLNMIYLPIQLTCVLLVYLDVRVRTEGLDLALKANLDPDPDVQLDEWEKLKAKTPADIVADAPDAEQGFFPRRDDLGKYFGLSFVAIGIYLALVGTIVAIGFALAGVAG